MLAENYTVDRYIITFLVFCVGGYEIFLQCCSMRFPDNGRFGLSKVGFICNLSYVFSSKVFV
jgi:hypothetical protein